MKSIVIRALEWAGPIICDVAGLGGCALIVYGVWKIYEPAGLIVAGLMLAVGAYAFAGRA